MRAAALAVALGACGPFPRTPPQHVDHDVKIGDATWIAHHLGDRVEYAGIWFADAACRKEFLVPRVIPRSEHAALAGCLAGLHLAPDNRHELGFDLFTYGPALEIEMLTGGGDSGTDITWIGYLGSVARTSDAILPTVTQAAFEPLRVSGDPLPADVHAWFKVCIDHAGAVTGVHPSEIDDAASLDALEKTISAWTFHPLSLGGSVSPVCSWIENGKPSDPKDVGEVPIAPLDDGAIGPPRKRISGNTQIAPDDSTKQDLWNGPTPVRIVLTIRYCIAPAGNVTKVSLYTSSGVPAYDRRALDAVRGWRFAPADKETCDALTLIYQQT